MRTNIERDTRNGCSKKHTFIYYRKPKGIKQVMWGQGLLDPEVTYVSKLKKGNPNHEEGLNMPGCGSGKFHEVPPRLGWERHKILMGSGKKCLPVGQAF
jgi:hypothetical protein